MAKKKCQDAQAKLRTMLNEFYSEEEMAKLDFKDTDTVVDMLNNINEAVTYEKRVNKLRALALGRVQDFIAKVPEKLRGQAFMDMISGGGIRQKTEIYEALTAAQRKDLQIFMTPLERQSDYYNGIGNRMMADASEKFRIKTKDVGQELLGFHRSQDGQRNMIRAIFGDAVLNDKDAAGFAKIYSQTVETYRKLFNKYGGNIPFLEDYRVAQNHDLMRIRKVPENEWVQDIKNSVHLDRLIYAKDGKPITLSAAQTDKLIRAVYKSITSEGVFKFDVTEFSPFASKPMYARHTEHRIFHYKDADSWLNYADKYGGPDYYQGMMGHLEMMSREIAAMKMFGPNPDLMVKVIQKEIQKSAGTRQAGAMAVSTYDHLMGRNYALYPKFKDTMTTLRSLSLAPKIGGAVISAVSDFAFLTKTLRFNGLPVFRTYMRFMKALGGNAEDRVTLAKIGLLSDYATSSGRAANKFADVTGYGWASRMADFVVRASGLNHWTFAVKNTFGLEFSANMAEMSSKRWGDLSGGFKRAFERYGILESDWDIIRHSKKYNKGGVDFVDASQLGETVGSKYVSMIREETFFAAPEPGAKAKNLLLMGTTPGTVGSEMIKTATQLKSFPVSVLSSHFMRAKDLGVKGGLTYMGSLVAGTTVLGAMALQAKNLLAGRTTQDMDNAEFIISAMVQGGALGIISDFIFRDHTRVSSFAEFMAGPLAGDASVLFALAFGSPDELDEFSKDIGARYGSRVKRVFDRMVPDTWYLRAIIQRTINDQFGALVDPKWEEKQKRLATTMQKHKGQGYWWEPGDLLPGK